MYDDNDLYHIIQSKGIWAALEDVMADEIQNPTVAALWESVSGIISEIGVELGIDELIEDFKEEEE